MSNLTLTRAAENPSSVQQFCQLAEAAASKQDAKILVQYNADTDLLQVAREMQLNSIRVLTQVQTVRLRDLADEAELVTTGTQLEPWLKIRCRDGSKHVQVDTTQTINKVEDEDLSKKEHLAFLVVPCHPTELKKLQEAYAALKRSKQPRVE